MKKNILLAMLVMVSMLAFAQDDYTVITLKNGQKFSVLDSKVENITFEHIASSKMLDPWFLTGYDIADGNWGFTVGESCVPMTVVGDFLTYIGYFGGGGFKIVGPELNWQNQWGMWSWYDWSTDGGSQNIEVPNPGYYTIELYPKSNILNIYENEAVHTSYSGISIAGNFSGWMDTEMTPCSSNADNHDWYIKMSFSSDDQLKFKETGNWENNWGSDAFPYGVAALNGVNIPVKAGDYTIVFNDITGGYTFWDGTGKGANAELDVYGMEVSGGYSVDFADENLSSMIKVFDSKLNLLNGYVESYTVSYGGYTVNATSDGYVNKEDLENLIIKNFGKAREQRNLTLEVSANVVVNDNKCRFTGTVDFSAILEQPDVSTDPFIYSIGTTEGWTNYGQKLALTDPDNGTYTGYQYISDQGGDIGFKYQRKEGDWDTQITAEDIHSFNGDASSMWTDCFSVSAGEGVYYIELNPTKGTYNAIKVNVVGITGDFNGWSDDVVMTWDKDNYCFVAENPGITENGWKFRMNRDWNINLGGTIDNLVGFGANLYVVGNTIKLYPTRRGSDNIYCTVE